MCQVTFAEPDYDLEDYNLRVGSVKRDCLKKVLDANLKLLEDLRTYLESVSDSQASVSSLCWFRALQHATV